jgi:hypothetical protein
MAPLSVTFVYNKSQPISDSIVALEKLFSKLQDSIRQVISKAKHSDINEPLIHSDIMIHVTTPVFSAVPWGYTNILVVNPEQWSSAFHGYLHAFDAIFFSSQADMDSFCSKNDVSKDHLYVIPLIENYNDILPACQHLQKLVSQRKPAKGIYHCPPILDVADCPPISIITPTYNRKNLIEIAFHNLLATDYPQNKIEWIVIEDNEKTPHMAGEKIMNFQLQVPQLQIKYIPIEGRMTIGEKRNHAIENSSHDIILFMDDDDHYPSTSFRRRVAWLKKGMKCGFTGANIACCTTLALYDLKLGTSAVNVPPFDIPFSQRISEATLTFQKSAWVERRFPNVSIAEGDNWISGRENQVIEIPPQQIIVAFSHGTNQSSRRVPPVEQKPSCFWGFPKEYLVFIHGLVGVTVEEDTRVPKKK